MVTVDEPRRTEPNRSAISRTLPIACDGVVPCDDDHPRSLLPPTMMKVKSHTNSRSRDVLSGVLAVGFQSSATDDLNGTTNLARGVLVGALLPYDHLLGRVAVGSASARRCIVRGEQATNRNCTSGTRTEIALAADYLITTEEAAEEAGVTAAHLKHLRRTGRGPSFHLIGPRCGRYRLSEVLAWKLSR